MAPMRLTSWVFHVGTAGAPGEIYAPPAPLTRLPAPAACHPSPGLLLPSVEVLTQEGGLPPLLLLLLVVMSVHVDSLIERLILEFGDQAGVR